MNYASYTRHIVCAELRSAGGCGHVAVLPCIRRSPRHTACASAVSSSVNLSQACTSADHVLCRSQATENDIIQQCTYVAPATGNCDITRPFFFNICFNMDYAQPTFPLNLVDWCLSTHVQVWRTTNIVANCVVVVTRWWPSKVLIE